MRIAVVVFVILGLSACSGCKSNNNPPENQVRNLTQEELIELNKQEAREERDQIEAYINRKGWNMQQTGTGLRFEFLSQVDSSIALVKNEQEVMIHANVELLNGESIYSTAEKGPQWFKVGKSNVESGLHEGIQLMRLGEKARFIMPAHLAHGLAGNFKSIPPKSSLIYQVEVIQVR